MTDILFDGTLAPLRSADRNYSILYIYEGFTNPGDGFVYIGARHILQRTLPVVCEQSLTLRDERDLYQLDRLAHPDIVAVVGAPWLFDNAANSSKLKALSYVKQQFPNAIYLALGIGSCVLAPYVDAMHDPDIACACVAPIFAEFDFISARDAVAHAMLRAIGIDVALLPCPSFFLPESFPALPSASRDNLAIITPVSAMWHYEHLEPSVRESYADFLTAIPNSSRRLAWVLEDCPDGKPGPETLIAPARDPRALAQLFADAGEIWTTRVHVAVPAKAYGCNVTLYGVDSRALTASAVGCTIVGPYAKYDSPTASLTPAIALEAFYGAIRDAVRKKMPHSAALLAPLAPSIGLLPVWRTPR